MNCKNYWLPVDSMQEKCSHPDGYLEHKQWMRTDLTVNLLGLFFTLLLDDYKAMIQMTACRSPKVFLLLCVCCFLGWELIFGVLVSAIKRSL